MERETTAFVVIAIFLGVWMVMKKHGPEWKRKVAEQRQDKRSEDRRKG